MIFNMVAQGGGGITPTGTLSITSNGTYDVASYASASVNVSGGGGDDNFAKLAARTIVSVNDSTLMSLGTYAFASCVSLTTIIAPNVSMLGGSCFTGCTKLETVQLPKIRQTGSNNFGVHSLISTLSFPELWTVNSSAFRQCFNLISLYLMGSSYVTLDNVNAFSSTPIGGYSDIAGQFGSIYVPASMYSSYISRRYWSVYSARFVSV